MLAKTTLLLLLVSIASSVSVPSLYKTKIKGKLTFYGNGADSGGTCMYNNPKFNLNLPTVAIGDWQNGAKCGMCVMIYPDGTGTGNSNFPKQKPFMAFVNNLCSECGENNLDLAQTGDGIWDIHWQAVDCPVKGNVVLQLKGGSSVYHTEISVRNFRNSLASLEYYIDNNWKPLTRQSYNYFLYPSLVTLPLQARLTSVFGEKKVITITKNIYSVLEPVLTTSTVQFSAQPKSALEDEQSEPNNSVSAPVIIGISVGCALLVAIIVIVVVFRLKRNNVESF